MSYQIVFPSGLIYNGAANTASDWEVYVLKKVFFANYKKYMIKPILYKIAVRLAAAGVLSFIWYRFINTSEQLHVVTHLFPVVGAVFFGLGWISYLHLDKFGGWGKLKKRKRKKNSAQMWDHVDTEVVSFSELQPEERILCNLAANAVCCLLFMAAYAVGRFAI